MLDAIHFKMTKIRNDIFVLILANRDGIVAYIQQPVVRNHPFSIFNVN